MIAPVIAICSHLFFLRADIIVASLMKKIKRHLFAGATCECAKGGRARANRYKARETAYHMGLCKNTPGKQ